MKLHKWFLGFLLLAMLVSFSGHAHEVKVSVATSELVQQDVFKVGDVFSYLSHFEKDDLEMALLSFSKFYFDSFIKTQNRKYRSQLLNQDLDFITFKKKLFLLISMPTILTSDIAPFSMTS